MATFFKESTLPSIFPPISLDEFLRELSEDDNLVRFAITQLFYSLDKVEF